MDAPGSQTDLENEAMKYSIHTFVDHPQLSYDQDMLQFEVATQNGNLLAIDTLNKDDKKKETTRNYFVALCALVLFLQLFIPQLKNMWALFKKQKIVTEKFTLFMPRFLYANDILTEQLTGSQQIGYKQIKRYQKIKVGRVKELWAIAQGKWAPILPCDKLKGPFISGLDCLYTANKLVSMLLNNSEFDPTETIKVNFLNNKFMYYYYAEDLTFFRIDYTTYDRKVYFQNNPPDDPDAPQDWDSRAAIGKKTGLKSRKQILQKKQFANLEKIIQQKNDRIEYLEDKLTENNIEFEK
eukprot:528490_1